jgi:hypothetical protein
MKQYILPVVFVLVALIVYDMFVKKMVIKESFEEGFEETYDE